jgi:hypothetical protein
MDLVAQKAKRDARLAAKAQRIKADTNALPEETVTTAAAPDTK